MSNPAGALARMVALDDVDMERNRQDAKWGAQRHLHPDRWNTILVEEVGEVSNAINERDWSNLATELTQVAAVCVAWLEDIALSNAEGMEITR